jgi:hypothetical protein
MTVYVDKQNDPTLNTIYVGTANSGLWKTTNAKSTTPQWTCLTDNARIPLQGVSAIAINTSSTPTIYVSTGCWRGATLNKFYSMGIIKSVDGGATWSETDLTYDVNNPGDFVVTQNIVMAPWKVNGKDVLYVFRQDEVYISEDGGDNFSLAFTHPAGKEWRDLRFINSGRIIATADLSASSVGEVWIATNNGKSSSDWTDITDDVFASNSSIIRVDVDVYENNKNIIYVAGAKGKSATIRIAKSIDGGTTWNDWDITVSGLSQQRASHYNDIAISKDNPDRLYSAGTTVAMSTNGGTSFTKLWNYWNPYVHPDQRDLQVISDGQGNDIVYSAHDGGLSRSENPQTGNNGSDWDPLNGEGLTIAETIGLGVSLNEDWIATGLFDMGWYDFQNGNWTNHLLGDGLQTEYDPYSSPEKMVMGSNWSPGLYEMSRTSNSPSEVYSSSRVTWDKVLTFDSKGALYQGVRDKLYRRDFGANTSTVLFTRQPQSGNTFDAVSAIAPAPSNPDVVYFAFEEPRWTTTVNQKLFRSSNAYSTNPTFEDITSTSGLPLEARSISDIVVDPHNTQNLWVCLGQTIDTFGRRVFYSSNSGSSFVELEPMYYCDGTTIMPWSVNKLVYDEVTGGLYAGTDIGVYFNPDPTSETSNWIMYNKDFPVVRVTDMEINHCTRKIYVSTYGRGLMNCDLIESGKKSAVINQAHYLKIEEDEVRIFNTDITIASGYTMTVKGTLKMATNKKITVEPGGKLVVDGGVITSTCDLMWHGIVVEGDAGKEQNETNQGLVFIKRESSIENARTAVHLAGLLSNGQVDWKKTGGILKVSNSTFLNNERDIAFLEHSFSSSGSGRVLSTKCFATGTKFITDDNFKGNHHKPGTHITAWAVQGIKLTGCIFHDQRTSVPLNDPRYRKNGIKAVGSTFNIVCSSSMPYTSLCDPNNQSKFINLYSAIEILGHIDAPSIAWGTLVENCLFDQNTKGITVVSQNAVSINNNTFQFDGYNLPIIDADPEDQIDAYGIYLDGASTERVEGNKFIGDYATRDPGHFGVGIVVKNNGPMDNTIYRNRFSNLYIGSEAIGNNKDQNVSTEGLKFLCNTYSDLNLSNNKNLVDAFVHPDETLQLNSLEGLPQQGSLNHPAGNEFGIYPMNEGSHYLNETVNNVIYHHHKVSSNSRVKPTIINAVFNIPTTEDYSSNSCPTKNTSGIGTNLDDLGYVTSTRFNKTAALTDWRDTEDGGDTEELLDFIDSVNTGNVDDLFDTLEYYSPYLSLNVLRRLTVATLPISDEFIRDILLKNPQSGRDNDILFELVNRSDSFPVSYIDQIDSNGAVISARDSMLALVYDINHDYTDALNDLLQKALLDSLDKFDEIIEPALLDADELHYKYVLFGLYKSRNLDVKANNLLTQLPIVFDLDSSDNEFYQDFVTLNDSLNAWENDSINLMDLDSTSIAFLEGYLDKENGIANQVIPMLQLNDSIEYRGFVYGISSTTTSEPFQGEQEDDYLSVLESSESNFMIVFPNPSEGNLKVSFNLPFSAQKGELYILNANGKTIEKYVVEGSSGLIEIDLKGQSSGTYYCRLMVNNTLVKTIQFALIK